MKYPLLTSLALILMYACTDLCEPVPKQIESCSHLRDISTAITIADTQLQREYSRSNPQVSVYALPCNRNNGLSDTIAYIINYDNPQAFAVIAADDRIMPVLAFSDDGNFTSKPGDDTPAAKFFLDLIPDYVAAAIDSLPEHRKDDYGGSLAQYGTVSPIKRLRNWHQGAPYNAHCPIVEDSVWIEEEERVDTFLTNALVGCVPMACAQIITECLNSITQGSVTIPNTTQLLESVFNSSDTISTAYKQNLDIFAQFLYHVGMDNMPMQYGSRGTISWKSYVRPTLNKYGCSLTSTDFEKFNIANMVRYMDKDHLLLMWCDAKKIDKQNNNTTTVAGHCWIADGCKTQLEPAPDQYDGRPELLIPIQYLHYDWGWDGRDNGYFSEGVFTINRPESPHIYTYYNFTYLAVKREKSYNKQLTI